MTKVLIALLLTTALGTSARADELPKEFIGTWCLIELADGGELQVYKRAVRFCRPDRLMVLKIMPNGFVKFTTKGPNTLCATPTFEPGPKSGGVVTAACGADDNSSPVRRVEHYVYPMTDDRLGVRVIH
jgi:hypothetical protein